MESNVEARTLLTRFDMKPNHPFSSVFNFIHIDSIKLNDIFNLKHFQTNSIIVWQHHQLPEPPALLAVPMKWFSL